MPEDLRKEGRTPGDTHPEGLSEESNSDNSSVATPKSKPSMKAHATAYALRGWRVFPLHSPQGSGCSCKKSHCPKRGKHPRIANWQNDATTDTTQVAAWWSQWPEANIGLLLDGLVVLDVDPKNGGFASLAGLEKEYGGLQARARQRSGSGGWHYLFEPCEGVAVARGFRPGLDLLTGAGCYIVAAPSLHASGDRYEWTDEPHPVSYSREAIPLLTPPAWLIHAALNPKPATEGATRDARPAERVPVARILEEAITKATAGEGRNNAGLWYFCQLRDNGYSREEAIQAKREWVERANAATPDESRYTLGEADASLRQAYKRAAREPWPQSEKRANQTEILEELTQDLELFHTAKGEAFARVPMADHVECWPVESKTFRGVLNRRFFRKQNSTPSKDTLQAFVDLLCARAQFDGAERETFLRFAHSNGRVYLDLGNDAWQVVEIDAAGWRVLSESPVCFRRAGGMKALPVPVRGATLDALRQFINAREDSHWVLIVAWLVGAFMPKGAFPILLLQGSQGSAKSTTATLLRNLIDPATVALSAPPRDERELAITATNSGIVAFDNLSGVQSWLSDALCRIATGAGFRTRTLHTNSDEELFETRSPLLLNGIDEIASRADLLDRGIGITLCRISDEQRKTEEEVQAGFHAAHAGVLGALLDAVSAGLRNLKDTTLANLPRMADFAKWVSACEPALPWKPGTFMSEYLENRQRAAESSVENDPVAQAVVRLVERLKPAYWQGTPSDLLTHLTADVDADARGERWPKAANSLTRWLRRAEPSLLAVGVSVAEFRAPGGKRERLITVKATGPQVDLWPIDARRAPWLEDAA